LAIARSPLLYGSVSVSSIFFRCRLSIKKRSSSVVRLPLPPPPKEMFSGVFSRSLSLRPAPPQFCDSILLATGLFFEANQSFPESSPPHRRLRCPFCGQLPSELFPDGIRFTFDSEFWPSCLPFSSMVHLPMEGEFPLVRAGECKLVVFSSFFPFCKEGYRRGR